MNIHVPDHAMNVEPQAINILLAMMFTQLKATTRGHSHLGFCRGTPMVDAFGSAVA